MTDLPWNSQIIPDKNFHKLLDILRGRRCELIENPYGNWGDRLIHIGFMQLFQRNSIEIVRVSRVTANFRPCPHADTLLLYGGGSVGGFYSGSPGLRKGLKKHSQISQILLPQSAFDANEDLSHFDFIGARESDSLKIMEDMGSCFLAPDGALAIDPEIAFPDFCRVSEELPEESTGVFLRQDSEKPKADLHLSSIRDPSTVPSFTEFLELPRNFSSITTNRLHFAIWSIYMRRSVVLMPNSYHKNRAMYEAWLGNAGLTNFSRLIRYGVQGSYESDAAQA